MKEKGRKKTKTTAEYDSPRETRVLLEEITKSVKTVAEQHGTIVKKLEEHDKCFERMELEFGVIRSEFSTMKSEFSSIKSELGTVKSGLSAVEMAVLENSRDIKVLKTDAAELKEGQAELKSDVAELKESQAKLGSDVEQLKCGQKNLELGQQEIKQKLDIVTDNHERRLQKLEAIR